MLTGCAAFFLGRPRGLLIIGPIGAGFLGRPLFLFISEGCLGALKSLRKTLKNGPLGVSPKSFVLSCIVGKATVPRAAPQKGHWVQETSKPRLQEGHSLLILSPQEGQNRKSSLTNARQLGQA